MHTKHRSNLFARAGVFLLLSVPSVVLAQSSLDWTLTTADFLAQPVRVQAIDSNGVNVGGEKIVPFSVLLDLTRAQSSATKPARFTLDLAGGDRVAGEPVTLADEQLTWKSAALGAVKIPLREILGVSPGADSTGVVHSTSATEDVVQLTNGDVVRGVVAQFDSTGATVTVHGDATPVPLASISRIDLAQTGSRAPESPGGPRFRLRLTDGSRVTARNLSADAETVKFDLAGAPRSLNWSDVLSVEQLDGPVSWLSARTPVEQVQTPHLSGKTWPAQPDRAVDGGPLRFGPRTFAHGVGVHAYSRLVYDLDGAYQLFRTQYALAGDLPYADVTVRVIVDDKVVHEAKNVRAGTLSDLIKVDISAAKRLTLEVDYGVGGDVQDRFNWLEAVLVKAGR